MRLRLKTKITLIIVLLVLTVVGVTSWLHVLTLTRQVIQQADGRANLVAQQVFFQAQNALADAATRRPAAGLESPRGFTRICAQRAGPKRRAHLAD